MSLVVTTPISIRFYLVWRREWIKKAGHPSDSKSDMSGWGIGAFLVESGLPSTLTGILAAGSTMAIYASHDYFAERSIFSDRFEARDGWLVNAFVQGIWPNIMAHSSSYFAYFQEAMKEKPNMWTRKAPL
ncbi:hypothetical protein BKA70DRAFT_1411760, partial [Coprinopsis sp. MPI-PUGE-AT-0042]